MSSQQNCERKDMMIEAAAVREVYPRHSMKLLARLMEVPLDTARHWLYRRFSPERTRELALKLLAELDEQEKRRAELRHKLRAIAHGEAGDVLAGKAVRPIGLDRSGSPAADQGC